MKVRKFSEDFYAGVGFNDVTYFGDTDQCSVRYNAARSEDHVLGLVGAMSAAIFNAQSTTELAATLNASTFDSTHKRDAGFFLEVFDQTGTVVGHGERPSVVGLSLEALFLELGCKVLSSDDYSSSFSLKGGSHTTGRELETRL